MIIAFQRFRSLHPVSTGGFEVLDVFLHEEEKDEVVQYRTEVVRRDYTTADDHLPYMYLSQENLKAWAKEEL